MTGFEVGRGDVFASLLPDLVSHPVTGDGVSGLSVFGRVFVGVSGQLAGGGTAALTVVVEGSADGTSWSPIDTVSLTGSGSETLTVDSPAEWMRARVTVVSGVWSVAASVVPAEVNAAAAGGGSLPSWWTVDSTPGSEDVAFAGKLSITPGYDTQPLTIETINGGFFTVGSFGGLGITPGTGAGADNALIVSSEGGNADILVVQADEKIGFFGAAPVARPSGVAVDAASIHAALVTLGLISA